MLARSPSYWYDEMMKAKNSLGTLNQFQPLADTSQKFLADITSKSKVAIWRVMFWVVACGCYALDVVVQLAIIVMTELARNSRYGTEPWYVDTAKKFQYGDALTLINLQFQYATVDEAKKIIKYAACQEVVGGVNIKVAKDVGGVTTKLATLEFNAFLDYIADVKPAGINVNCISDDPDELRYYGEAFFDPQVLKDNGELIDTPGTFPLVDAVNTYLKTLNTVEFDGRFDILRCADFIRAARGIKRFYPSNAMARYGANAFEYFTQTYSTNAGHIKIEDATPLSDSITYTADV